MCDNCKGTILRDSFYSPQDYMDCLDYIKQLIDSSKFNLTDGNCAIDKVKNDGGYWVDDIIFHVICCNSCGKSFSCSVNTYRGSGSFKRGR